MAHRVGGQCLQGAWTCPEGAASQLARCGLDREGRERELRGQWLQGWGRAAPGAGFYELDRQATRDRTIRNTEPYLGEGGLRSSPPEVGLWGLQDMEGVAHWTSLLLLDLEGKPGHELSSQPCVPIRLGSVTVLPARSLLWLLPYVYQPALAAAQVAFYTSTSVSALWRGRGVEDRDGFLQQSGLHLCPGDVPPSPRITRPRAATVHHHPRFPCQRQEARVPCEDRSG